MILESKLKHKIYLLIVILLFNKNQRKYILIFSELQITGYSTEYFQIDDFYYPPCVILTPNQVLNW